MFENDENELTAAERTMLSALTRELPPGDLLEERVVRALKNEGHFGSSRARGGLPAAWKIAAAIALFAGGVATGRYLMMPEAAQSASQSASQSQPAPATIRASDTTPAAPGSIPVRNETVVAVRELWL